MSKPFIVRDFRKKQFFMVDDAYLNGYAKYLGAHASCVYLSLCRHADKKQSAYPSEESIALEFDMSVRTVRSKIKILKRYNLIRTIRERTKKGTWEHNIYYLIDKSEWIKPEATVAHGQPEANNSRNQRQITAFNQRQEMPPKDTHIYEGNTYKETQKNLVDKITHWAYYEALNPPSFSEHVFSAIVTAAIQFNGEEKVRELYADQENAIAFITDLKYLKHE